MENDERSMRKKSRRKSGGEGGCGGRRSSEGGSRGLAVKNGRRRKGDQRLEGETQDLEEEEEKNDERRIGERTEK